MSEAISCPRARAIYDEVRRLLPGAAQLPFCQLDALARQALGGRLFDEAPAFVEHTARALLDHPTLFGALPEGGAALLQQQERAAAWRMLAAHLRAYLQVATDAYLYEQSAAIATAQRIHRHVAAEAALPLGRDPAAEKRRVLLDRAAEVLRDRRKRTHARHRRRLVASRSPASGADPGAAGA